MRFHRRAPPFVAAYAVPNGRAGPLAAQGVGSVRGRVVEEGTLRPMAGGNDLIYDVLAGNSACARGLSLTASRYNS